MKITRKLVRDAKKKIRTAGKRVDHMSKVLEGFNFYIEKKAVRFDLPNVYLYPELLGSDPKKAEAWLKNAYIYARLKLKLAEGDVLFFRNIETNELIVTYRPD